MYKYILSSVMITISVGTIIFFMSFSYIPFKILFHYMLSQDINIVSYTIQWASFIGQSVKNLPAMQETWV